jgi:hypothetical protein
MLRREAQQPEAVRRAGSFPNLRSDDDPRDSRNAQSSPSESRTLADPSI